ncbi:MAG: alkaline phosphatase family protein [Acidimicrobiales bacterium]
MCTSPYDHLHSLDDFYQDARHGRLPSVSLITPDIAFASEGEYQDDQIGEALTATVYNAVSSGPQWPGTLFVVVWDEGGGFYDHVPPPPAVAPDDVPPDTTVPPDQPGGFDRYGFRVPCLVASPYSKPGYVSSVIYDHTSITATIEHKWNLPPLTNRDAAAAPLWDFLDLEGPPAFLTPPALPEPAMWPFTGLTKSRPGG